MTAIAEVTQGLVDHHDSLPCEQKFDLYGNRPMGFIEFSDDGQELYIHPYEVAERLMPDVEDDSILRKGAAAFTHLFAPDG